MPSDLSTRRPDWRRIALVFGPLLLLLILFVLRPAPWLTRVGAWLHESEAPADADVIIVLGGDSVNRMITAMDLYREGRAAKLAFTVPAREIERVKMTNYEKWVRLLETRAIDIDSVDILSPSHSTYDDAAHVRNYMERMGFKRALVVTDPYHTRRAGWIVRRALLGSDASITVVAANQSWFDPARWWKDEDQLIWVVLEYSKFAYYVVNYGFRGPLRGEAGALHDMPHSK